MNWDEFRRNYSSMSYKEHQEFYSKVYEQYPVQEHFDTRMVERAIDFVRPTHVIELGGWDGGLARRLLPYNVGIKMWDNYEICREALEASTEDQADRYFAMLHPDWYWESGPHPCDLFIASHTIEHLSAEHLDKTIEATDAKALFFDAPLLDEPIDWMGSTTTHVLEVGWDGVTQLCEKYGYHLKWAEDHLTDASSGGFARACLYAR